MADGLFCGTTSGRLSLRGFVFRMIAAVGSSSFVSVGFRFGVTTAGPASGAAFRFLGGGFYR
jgi:hypothetical protein